MIARDEDGQLRYRDGQGMRVYDLIFGVCWWTVMVAGPVILAVSAR